MSRIIIVGAGIVGLILGQALKSQNIPFTILERDGSANIREQGWAITLHWALPLLKEMLPRELIAQIERCQVNFEDAESDTRDFKFINLKDCSEIFNTPSAQRWRVDRGKLRLALMDGLESSLRWNQHVEGIQHLRGLVRIRCSDGSLHIANVVIGADGSRSVIRKFLCPEKHEVTPLPFRMFGVRTELTEEQAAPLRSIDRLIFQGCEPGTGTFLYCSLLESSTKETSSYAVQFNLSWPKSPSGEEMLADNASRLELLKLRARGFAPCLKAAIEGISEGKPVLEIQLADWEMVDWNNSSPVTLAGDAAHPMTMFRGEAANHGIRDVYDLWKALDLVYHGTTDIRDAIQHYETEMTQRASIAILESRRACVDAHNYPVDEDSPLLTERKMPRQSA